SYRDHRRLRSFPTRRSSDLAAAVPIPNIVTGISVKAIIELRLCCAGVKTFSLFLDTVRPRRLGVDRRVATAFLDCVSADSLRARSEEHTSELQSRFDLVCRL